MTKCAQTSANPAFKGGTVLPTMAVLSISITGDQQHEECLQIVFMRGKKRATKISKSEFHALISALNANCDVIMEVCSGSTMSIEVAPSSSLAMTSRTLSPPIILINGIRPLAITKAEFISVMRSPRLAQRALYWTRRGYSFVKIFREGGRGSSLLIDTQSVEFLYTDLLKKAKSIPLMPGETERE